MRNTSNISCNKCVEKMQKERDKIIVENKVDMTALANYVRVKQPDKDKLAELVIRSKGSKRSMRQFARECGIDPSTMSRIINKKISRASSDEVIISIAEHADEESGVTIEMLMDAHGKVPRRMSGRLKYNTYSTIENTIKDIISKELLERGYIISTPKTELTHNALNYKYCTDWALLTDANSTPGKIELWEFEFWPTIIKEEKEVRHVTMKLRQKFLMVLGLYYTGNMSPKKMSFVLTERKVYDYLLSTLKEIEFTDLFSLILINVDKAIVEEEYLFPVKGNNDVHITFTKIDRSQSLEKDGAVKDNGWEDNLFDI